MIIELTASAVRGRAKRAGFEEAIVIRTGRPAETAEGRYVSDEQCSVRIALLKSGVEDWLETLPRDLQD